VDTPSLSIDAPEKLPAPPMEDASDKPDMDAGAERHHRRKRRKKRKKELAKLQGMFFNDGLVSRKDKHNLYYLFPGMGKGARKRFFRNLIIAIIVGLLLSAGLWGVAVLMSR
jgi:hypothetical protein